MKKLLVLILVVIGVNFAHAQTKQGDSSLGLTVGYSFDSDSKHPILNLDYRYNITDEVRVAPSISHFFTNKGFNAWMGEVNAHYVVKLDDKFGFYPLGGLSFSSWKKNSCKWNRLGANIGLGGEVYATDQISVGLEVKYSMIKYFSHPMAGVRVGYNF